MPVLDSSFIVDLLRGNEEALKKLAEMEEEYTSLSTTEINVLELYRGAYRSMKTHQNLEKIKEILECFHILDLKIKSIKYLHPFLQVYFQGEKLLVHLMNL